MTTEDHVTACYVGGWTHQEIKGVFESLREHGFRFVSTCPERIEELRLAYWTSIRQLRYTYCEGSEKVHDAKHNQHTPKYLESLRMEGNEAKGKNKHVEH